MEPNCVSINLGPLKGETHKCELNNATDENHFITFLKNEPSYTYMAIKNPCSSSPCLNNGTCQAGFTSKGFRCICHPGFNATDCCQGYKNCAEIYKSGARKDGVYTIKPDNLPAFDVFCDQTTAGGGWTVFQKRLDGSVDFYRNWSDYKVGFGDLNGEFWLGLDKMHRLTSDNISMLRVDLEDFEGNTAYAEYNKFGVMSENNKYKLKLGSYSAGNAEDSLSHQSDQPFSTNDQDNSRHTTSSGAKIYCASKFHGAWWYSSPCHESNLNGKYHNVSSSPHGVGVNWKSWKGHEYSLKKTEMKTRPKDFETL